MIDDREVLLALRARLKTVTGLPDMRVWVNAPVPDPVVGVEYIEEEFTPSVTFLLSSPPAGATLVGRGLYLIHWYGAPESGAALLAKGTNILSKFAPGTIMTTASGVAVRVRTDIGPTLGPVENPGDGFAVVTATIAWWAMVTNTIAA